MSYLVLVVFMLIPFVWADDAANKTASLNMTTAVSVVKRELTARPYGKRGYANALALVKREDACANFDPEKDKLRKTKNDLLIAEKSLSAAGHIATAAGELASSVPIFGDIAGGPLKAAGSALQASAALMGAASLSIDVETRELEYMKCARKQSKQEFEEFKKDFDEFKNKFNKFRTEMKDQFDKTFQKFDDLNKKLDNGFNEIKDMMQNIETDRIMSDYQLKISSIKTLKMHFRSYTKHLVQDARSKLFIHCATKDPLEVLNAIDDVHVGLVLKTIQNKSEQYGLLKNRCTKITSEVLEVAQMAVACFEKTISDQNKSEEARVEHTEEIVKIVQNIMKQMQEAMQKAKQDLINNIIPAKFPHQYCQYVREFNKLDLCRKHAEPVSNYLRNVHSWAEWTVVATTGRCSRQKIEYDPHNAILGEAKNINPVNESCSYSVIWCEKDDDNARKENAQHFKKWKDPSFLCTGDVLPAFVESLQNKLTNISSSPSLPNSPKIWQGIMAILTSKADEQYQNLNAIDFGNDHSKFGDDNLIRGYCKMAYGHHYHLYYHVCF